MIDRLPPFFVASVGMVVLTVMDAIIKALSSSHGTAQIVLFRFLLMGLIIAGIVIAARQSWPSPKRLKVHFGRAVLMLIASSTFFYALGRLPLADVFVLALTSPIFVALFAMLFLKEPVRPAVAIAIAMGFAGVLVMILGEGAHSSGAYEPLAIACAVTSPISYALGLVLLRKQTAQEPVTVIICVQSLLVALLVAPVAAFNATMPTSTDLLLFASIGVLGAAGNLAFGNGLKRMPAARFSMIEYTGVIWAALLGYAFFGETPGFNAWIGTALIVAGCLVVVSNRAAPPPPAADAPSNDAAAAGQDQRA